MTSATDLDDPSDSSMSSADHTRRRNVSGFKITVSLVCENHIVNPIFTADDGKRLHGGSGQNTELSRNISHHLV